MRLVYIWYPLVHTVLLSAGHARMNLTVCPHPTSSNFIVHCTRTLFAGPFHIGKGQGKNSRAPEASALDREGEGRGSSDENKKTG